MVRRRPKRAGASCRAPAGTVLAHERLEPRRCLSVEPLHAVLAPAAATADGAADAAARRDSRIRWQGALVDVVADAWILGLAPPATVGTLSLPPRWTTEPLGEGLHALIAPEASVDEVLGWAALTRGVSFVEPDFVVAPSRLPNDPAIDRLWGLSPTEPAAASTAAGIGAPAAWDVTTGSRDVVVAVIDTGVDIRHPDLAANIWRNPGEIPGDGVDNDANGFVDDVHGWNFVRDTPNPRDDNGHGTHVAGTIGAVGDNGIGGTGVAWQVSIMPLKFLDRRGSGATSDAVAAINYATRMRRDFGINVVATSNSWGGSGPSASLRVAIAAGGAAGILFVAAAGNDGEDNDRMPTYPASDRDDSVIAVAAIDRIDRPATFSNTGATSVDLAAPGVRIRSTAPDGRSATFSGTSMAVPHVTGTIALLAAANPAATAAEIRRAVLTTARPVPALTGLVRTGGIVDAGRAVRAILDLEALAATDIPDAPPPVGGPGSDTPPAEPPGGDVPPAVDFGDLRGTAQPVARRSGAVTLRGTIGDGRFAERDVDLFGIQLAAGQRVVIEVAARPLPGQSRLDSVAGVFSRTGRRLAFNDDHAGASDSRLVFEARRGGIHFVGVSGFGNAAYRIAGGGRRTAGSVGDYAVTFTFDAAPSSGMTPHVFGFVIDAVTPRGRSARGHARR